MLVCLMLTACASAPFMEPNDAGHPVVASHAVVSSSTPVSTPAKAEAPKKSEIPPKLKQSETEAILALFQDGPTNKSSPTFALVPEPDAKDLQCMARVMYFEARGEGERGMIAVGHVVMNRKADDRFPSTVCGVVKQGKYVNGKPVRNRCQFSWVCDGIPDLVKDTDTFEKATALARSVLMGTSINPVSRSLYFHTTAVRPKWSRTYAVIKKIGRHVFYYA